MFSNQAKPPSPPDQQRGVTLVELLIATAIGLFLTAGIIALFSGTRQSYRTTEALSFLQENGRYALEYLARDLRKTGYRDIINTSTPPLADSIEGWEGDATAPTDAGLTVYTPETDVLSIRYTKPDSGVIVTHVFFVAPGANGAPALWQRNILGATTVDNELFQGVADMQIEYGLDTNGDGQLDIYADTPTGSNWDQVIAVRIRMLLGSDENNLTDQPMTLPFQINDGTAFTAGDRRLYQMFTTTVALRNRLL